MFGVWALPFAGLLVVAMLVINRRERLAMLAYAVLLLALLLNSAALLFNHGHMPVKQPHVVIEATDKVHVELTDKSRLKVLCDVHGPVGWRYSLGDSLCLVSLALFVAQIFVRRKS